MKNAPPILIAGAGPVGLTMALALRRQGIDCRIIDKSPTPSDKSKALVVWNRSLEMLDQLGVSDRFLASGVLGNGARMYGGGRELVHVELNLDGTRFPKPLMIPQSETERLLAEALVETGTQVERGVELKRFSETPEGVDATLRHPDGTDEILQTHWLIGCDGAHSTVRHTLGMGFTGDAEPNDWMLADVHIRGMAHEDELRIDWHEKGILAFFPMGGDRFRVIADEGKAETPDHPPDPSLADVQRAVDERGPGGLELFEPFWLAGFRIHERKISDYSRGRVFLAGDAAHIHSPAGGQGMNTGMQDAYNLAWKIALVEKGVAKPSLLDSYTTERSAVGDTVLRNAAALTSVATLRNPFAQFARNTVAGIAGMIPAFQHAMGRGLSELDIHYPHSPLNSALPRGFRHPHWKPGDRLPDVPLVDLGSGKPIGLLTAIRGAGFELLLASNDDDPEGSPSVFDLVRDVLKSYSGLVRPWLIVPSSTVLGSLPDGVSVLLDPDQQFVERSGATGDAMVLVRPDRYISLIDGPNFDHLKAALQPFLDLPSPIS